MIPYGHHILDEEDIEAVVEILRSESITQGTTGNEFSDSLSAYTGSRYCVAVSSGTAALQLAISAIGIGPGDEVITTPLTFCATANVVRHNGAEVRFVDIDKTTLNIDPENIEAQITARTKAIIPVDFRGHPAALPKIKDIADKYDLVVIEDGSHSLGSTYMYQGSKYRCGDGIHAELCTFSFHPVKHITTGEGGAILTNNEKLYKKMDCLSRHGITRPPNLINETSRVGTWAYDLEMLGYNFRLTDIQAALGLSQLKKIEKFKLRRREIVNYYNEEFSELEYLQTPFEDKNVDSNFHLYVLNVIDNCRFDRYDLYSALLKRNYQPMVHYIPLHFLSYYKQRYGFEGNEYPIAEKFYETAITIPLYPALSDAEVEEVVRDMKNILCGF